MPRRAPGPYRAGIARREAILEAATSYFARGGYHRTSMARIAADVGFTESGLLYHFPTKKHLLLAVIDQRITSVGRWVAETAAGATGRDVLRHLAGVTERLLTEPGLIELFVIVSAEAADTSSPAHSLFAKRYEESTGQLAALLSRAVDSGEFRADTDCAEVARECIATSDGLQLQWVLSGGRLDLAQAARAHLDRVARTVTADGAGL